jgi:hypothetical protein
MQIYKRVSALEKGRDVAILTDLSGDEVIHRYPTEEEHSECLPSAVCLA